MAVSEENRTIAKYLASAIGQARPKVTSYWDEQNVSFVDILEASDRPEEGVTTFATLGLSDHSIGLMVEDVPFRIEILGACESGAQYFANIVATCGFNIINSKMECRPGTIFRDVISMYAPGKAMKHVLFTPPFLWELETLTFASKKVAWLFAVPVSEAEMNFADENSTDALENLFEQQGIDIFDLDRSSVV